MILEVVYLIEWMILHHGTLMEFIKADSNDRGYISKAEADAAGWAADFDEYDVDENGFWDIEEYFAYAMDQMMNVDGVQETYENSAFKIDILGWDLGMMDESS